MIKVKVFILILVGVNKSILIPPDADLIVMKVDNLVWRDAWSTIFIFSIVDNESVCFSVSGIKSVLKENVKKNQSLRIISKVQLFNQNGQNLNVRESKI